jgi:hypothetical protein
MILLNNKAFEAKASIVSYKQPFAGYRNYKDHPSRLLRVLQEIFGCSTPYDVDGEGNFVWSLMSRILHILLYLKIVTIHVCMMLFILG